MTFYERINLVVGGALPFSHSVIAEAAPVVDDVQRERKLLGQPLEVGVDAGRLPPGVGEDGAVGHRVERALARHQGEDRGLDDPAEADDRQARQSAEPLPSRPVTVTCASSGACLRISPRPSSSASSMRKNR